METEIEPLNSPEKNDLNDTNYNHDYSLSEEFGVKRTFTEIINENAYEKFRMIQPFRSPLKANNHTNKLLGTVKKDEKSSDSPERNISSKENENNKSKIISDTTDTHSISTPKKSVKKAVFRSPLFPSKNTVDPEINALHKRRLELERKIWEADERIKTIETAKIYENKDDNKLEMLIDKWRLAAQQAAAQLFTIVSERIEAAGGIVAWYKQFEISRNIFSEWDTTPNIDSENLEQDKEYLPNVEDTSKSEEFTMTMMLEKLNISPNLIGWDIKTETWL
ncbi:unnamed protein product [Pneumocystis jirovecii]|uniref:Meiosis protein 5 homolog n=1 Tax=Pneumocystis jirovecii TaxID=42068 RepID=L0PCG2_PNEJI|nr:unnamed protein product [Pneumocystis jirovecii]